MLKKAAWLVCLGVILSASAGVVRGATISIRFEQIDSLAQTQTPQGRVIESEYARTKAERDESLRWGNPEIAYEREEVDQAEEYQITIGKQFAMPWVYLKERSSWSDRLRSAELMRAERTDNHLADLKAGYVTVRVHQQYLTRLLQLREILTDASHVADSRLLEGHLSGVEEHLIQMVVISLNAAYQDALQSQRETMANWRAALGFSPGDSVVLSSEIGFVPVSLPSIMNSVEMAAARPGIAAREQLGRAWGKQAAAARGAFIPSISLYGGLKKVDPDLDGYVAGVSVSLPLFHRNGATAKKYEAEQNIATYEATLFRNQTIGKVKALTISLNDSQSMLAAVAGHFEEDLEALNSLLFSYEEGWMSLSEMLNAIQIETAGLKDYYDQLIKYYVNLFELEALTGASLVRF